MTKLIYKSVAMVLVIALTACASLMTRPESPRISLIGLQPVSFELFEQRFLVSLRVKNPNQFVLPVRGLDFNMDINGKHFADGLSATHVDIPALGEGRVDVEVSSSLFNTFRQLQTILNQGQDFDYRIKGDVMLQNRALRLPFELSDSFSFAKETTL